MTALTGFAAGFVRVDEEAAVALAARHWGIDAVAAVRLDTERDDTFRLETRDGMRFVLKVSNPADEVSEAAIPTRALVALQRRDAPPVERVVRTGVGAIGVVVGPARRFARLSTWITGEGVRAALRTLDDVSGYGAVLARLHTAVATLSLRPAPSPWNLLELERYASAPAPSDAVTAVIAAARVDTVPRLRRLPAVLCHNDFHGDNVLVDPAQPARIVGVLDFGDLARTPRVAEFAVAASYVRGYVGETSDPWEPVSAFLDGYLTVAKPFDGEEQALLPALVRLRLAQRLLVNSVVAATGNAYAARNLASLESDLAALAEGAPA